MNEDVMKYLETRLTVDEVLRSEVIAYIWAKQKFGMEFISTAGLMGDLVSKDHSILLEVTTQEKINLRTKALKSVKSWRFIRAVNGRRDARADP